MPRRPSASVLCRSLDVLLPVFTIVFRVIYLTKMAEEKLIKLVRQHECLYDINSRNYSDRRMKKHTWIKISKEMNKTPLECQKLWTNIRGNYRKAVKTRASKSDDSRLKKKPIKFGNELEFLKDFIHERPQVSYFDSSSEEDNTPTQNNLPPTASEIVKQYLECQKQLETKKDDPLDMFFISMAATVKTFPPKLQAEVKRNVLRVVTNAELQYFGGNELDRPAPANFCVIKSNPEEQYIREDKEFDRTPSIPQITTIKSPSPIFINAHDEA